MITWMLLHTGHLLEPLRAMRRCCCRQPVCSSNDPWAVSNSVGRALSWACGLGMVVYAYK
jgi:hypothetical protein